MTRLVIITIITFFCLTPLMADEEGMIVRLAKVYPKAKATSKSIGHITAGSRVSIFKRKGGWKEVYSEERAIRGWVRSYQVREGNYVQPETVVETEEDDRGFLSGLASFSRKASGFFSGGNSSAGSARTATIGVRGLSEEEIKNAKPDLVELEKMHGVRQ